MGSLWDGSQQFGEDWSKTQPLGLFCVFKKGKNKKKNCTLDRKNHGSAGLKLGLHAQLDSGINMGWVPLVI